MKIKNCCNILYSHSDYSDIWSMYFGQTTKYLNDFCQNVVFTDKHSDLIPKDYIQIIYDDTKSYPERLIECFNQIKSEYETCMFSHEDMFLYSEPDLEKLAKYIDLVNNKKYHFIRLIKGGDHIAHDSVYDETLFEIDIKSNWIFSIQPSVWDIQAYMKLLKPHTRDNIWELEEKSQRTCKKMDIQGAYSFGQGAKRGMHHWDNSIYPYIATAIVKGKWNTLEYSDELKTLAETYNVSFSERGEFKG